MVLKAEVWGWREVLSNSISELILNSIFNDDLDKNIRERLRKSAPDRHTHKKRKYHQKRLSYQEN